MKNSGKKWLVFFFSVTYMVSYLTRINYGAVLAEMERSTQLARSLLSMAVTGGFITYGLGQIINGILGDRISPKKMVTTGFVVTTLMNLLIPFCANHYQMLGVWCINGFAQSMMWPPLVRIMTMVFDEAQYNRAQVRVSWGSSIGTILIYLLSPLIIALSGWKTVFFVTAVCGGAMAIFWARFPYDFAPAKKREVNATGSVGKMLFTPLMLCIMVAVVFMGVLRDGITTWMPSYISQTYDLSSSISILTGVVLPIFGMLCFQAADIVYEKKLKNPLLCAGVIFGVGALAALGLYLLSGHNAVFSVVFSAVITGSMHGVNLILIGILPSFFKKQGHVSTVSGVINSCTYVGSAISTYGVAVLSEGFGWEFTLFLWLMIAVGGMVICLLNIKPWNRCYG